MIKSTVLLFFLFMVAVKCQDTRPGGQREISQEEMNQSCPIYRQPSDDCPSSTCTGSVCSTPENPVCCSDDICGDVCRPNMTKCVDTDIFIENAIGFCLSDFAIAIGASKFSEYCVHLNKGLTCMLEKYNLEKEIYRDECLNRMKAYVKYSFDSVSSKLAAFGISYNVSNVNRSELCMTGKCRPDICTNQGLCTELYEDYKCNCSTSAFNSSQDGKSCSKVMGIKLQTNNMIKINFDTAARLPNTVGVTVLTKKKQGILMQMTNTAEPRMTISLLINNNGGVRFVLEAGFTRYEVNTISDPDADISDGKPHRVGVRLDRDNRKIYLHLDRLAPVVADIGNEVNFESLGFNYLYIGNNDTSSSSYGFEGCINSMIIDRMFPLKMALSTPTPSNVMLVPNGDIVTAQCDMDGSTNEPDDDTTPDDGEGGTDDDSDEDWNTKCPEIDDVDTELCPRQCEDSCSTDNDVCCSIGSNTQCTLCIPDMSQCGDIKVIKSKIRSCASDVQLALESVESDNFCTNFWSTMKCIANDIAGDSYHKLCQKRMIAMMTRSNVNVLDAFSEIIGLRVTDAARQFYRSVVRCRESPVYVEPNRPRPEGVDECSETNTIISQGRTCLEKLTETDDPLCSKLKRFVQCVAFKIYPEEREGSIKLKQCGDEITEIIRENIERLRTQLRPLGRFDLDDCEEKEVVCGGKSLEGVDCNTQSCPANYECQKGHCCPVEKPGQCPKRSGTPLCLEKCNKDSDCDDEKKCCNMGCGNSTCVESVMYEKTSCEMDLENAKKQLRKNGLCGDGKTVVALPRCLDNGRYDPIQGDVANGLLYCVDEKGKKIEGSDFRGNRDCTTVRPGKCRAKPDICTTDSGIIATCDSDQDCKTKGQKCCYGSYQNLCVRQCVDPITDDDDVLDTCTDRKCCPINLCNGKICSKDPSAVCRINSCGDCTVEFYNAMGELVDCEEGVSECEKTRTRAKESNKDRRDGGENENERLENFIQMLDKRRNRSGGDGMDDDDDDYDNNDRDDDDDNDDSEDIDDDEAPTGRRLMLAEGTLCHLFDTYGLCQYGSYCILGEGESTWEICNCSVAADGRHGLFCDSLDRTYQGSQCARDRGRIVDLLDILKNAAKVKENKALHSMFTTLKIPYIIKPECIDVMQNFSPVQKALALPRTSRAKDFYVCVDEINGKRIEYTPVSFNASQPPDCTIVNDMYPDLLTVSKKCVIPSPGDCLTEPCDYYWNIATGKCEQGFIRNGFRSASECYDACTVQPSCSEDLTTTEITNTESDEDYCVQEFGVGPLPCQSADKTKSECDFATEFCNVTVTNGLQTGQCESFPQRCLLAPDSGVGDKKLGRYAYDAKQRRCVKLLYKGEGGNKNRFETVHQCNTECSTRKYKYDDFACPPSTSLVSSGGAECYEDIDCPGEIVCCSDGTKRVCTMHVKTCSYGQRCPVDGAYCDNGKCVCLDCADAELAPVCGSDGETYESECHLKQYVCKTLKPITKQSDGECPIDICDVTDCDSTTVVCGRGQMYGAVRTFASECAMNKESCDGEEQYIKVPKENCDVNEETNCTKMCTLQYEPVCAYVRSTGGDEFKNYSNKCIMMRDKVCSDKDVHFLYDGECKGCGATNQMCQPYEECVDGVCGCRPGCTKEYNPVCAFEIDNPAKLEEFANDCLRRNHSCATKSIYIKKYDDRPCKKPEPIHVCPRTRRDIVRSATFQCNDVTNAFCDKDKEMCCPYGAGRRCIPKTRLIKKTRQKIGECPVQSPYNTDIEQCEHKCTDDSDCAGDAKCCSNMICGFDTCVAPKVKDPSTICGPNLRMLEDITCDPTSSDSGCPYGTCTQVTLKDGTMDAVCCVNEFQRTAVADLTGAELCIALKNVNVTCMNGGKCAANSTSGKICECQAGYYGLFCENKKPSDCATVQCFANPCNVTKCEAIPGATCKPNYCDGCHALFSYQGMDVTEKCKETVCLRRKSLFDKISSIIKRSRANQRELLRRIGEVSEEDDRDDRDHDDSRDVDEYDEELDDNDVGRDTFIDGLLEIVARIPGYVGFPNETISCTSRGNFAEKQCVKNDRGAFCFCADATTGAPIPRTRRSRTIKDLDCTMTADTENAPDFCHDETPDMTTECDETETLRFYFDSEALRCKGFKDKGCNSHLKNNFNSYKTCQSVCHEQSSRDSKCATVRCAQYTVCVEIGDSAQCISTDDAYGEYEPVCEEDGTYAIKQCNNDVCECVDPKTGDQVPESVTDGELLDCIIVEGKVRADKKDDKACPDNGRARFCENSGDSCRDCERRENGRNDGETGALRDDDDDNQDSDRGRPNKVTFDGTCARCETCPVGTKKKVCDAVCKQTECKNFPSAICEVNKCTCKEEFMANGVVVDCNRAQPLCNRTKHAQSLSQRAKRLQRMNNAQDEEEEEEEYVCGKDGSFKMKCTSTQCTCLDPTTLKPIGEKQDKNNVNCASAQRSRPEVIYVAFTITEKDIVLTVAKTRQFEAAATKKFDRFKTFMDENIKFSKPKITKGSVKVNVEMSCDGECEEIDLFSQANFVVAEINQETETIEVDGETFTLTNANIDQIVTTAELYGPATEPTTPDDKDDNSVTIIVVVVVLVVVLILAAAVAAYCYMKKNKSKTDEMPFHDLRGQDNPTYKS